MLDVVVVVVEVDDLNVGVKVSLLLLAVRVDALGILGFDLKPVMAAVVFAGLFGRGEEGGDAARVLITLIFCEEL